jgi:hypothetical protein
MFRKLDLLPSSGDICLLNESEIKSLIVGLEESQGLALSIDQTEKTSFTWERVLVRLLKRCVFFEVSEDAKNKMK